MLFVRYLAVTFAPTSIYNSLHTLLTTTLRFTNLHMRLYRRNAVFCLQVYTACSNLHLARGFV